MSKESFESILEKYLIGKCTPSEKLLVEQWYDLLGDEAKLPDSDEEWESIKTRMWIEISKESMTQKSPFWKSNFMKISVAASVLILMGLYYFNFNKSSFELKKGYLTLHENKTKKVKEIILADGSRISLDPGAVLSLSDKFNLKNREVELLGKAKFEVVKNADKPFLVHTNSLITKVVGTTFTVNANENAVQVAVISGKVSVYKQQDYSPDLKHKHQGVVINPNQQLNFTLENEKFEKTISDSPNLISSKEKINFNYMDSPASEVFNNIKNAYGVTIIFDEVLLSKCPVTADLTDETLYQKLFIVCKAIEANYETIDGQIIINSNGCK